MQLTRGMPGRLGHHWRTKCALSGYQVGKGYGFTFDCGDGTESLPERVGVAGGLDVSASVPSEVDGVRGGVMLDGLSKREGPLVLLVTPAPFVPFVAGAG